MKKYYLTSRYIFGGKHLIFDLPKLHFRFVYTKFHQLHFSNIKNTRPFKLAALVGTFQLVEGLSENKLRVRIVIFAISDDAVSSILWEGEGGNNYGAAVRSSKMIIVGAEVGLKKKMKRK